jgi:hypothetical protein
VALDQQTGIASPFAMSRMTVSASCCLSDFAEPRAGCRLIQTSGAPTLERLPGVVTTLQMMDLLSPECS